MRARDLIEKAKERFASVFLEAVKEGSTEKLSAALSEYAQAIQEALLEEYHESQDDFIILASRGVRNLTSEETKYYNAVIGAMKSENPQQAIVNLDVAMPETVIDAVLEDIESQFPILDMIDFQNTTAITKWIYNKQGTQQAKWGPLGSKITEELQGSIGIIEMGMFKLTAYMVISKDFLLLGPAWIDRYVRAILAEANGLALEAAVIDGDGSVGPIGMTRDMDKGSTAMDKTTYPRKEATKVSCFTPESYGEILAKLAKTPTGRQRTVTGVIMAVSPSDYFTKVMPATTILTPQGTYVSDVLPFPTTVCQSPSVPEGYAVIGIAKQYFAGMGSAKKGVITYDDSVQFLEDNRVYATHFYGNGRPKDNNSFVYLDISELTAPLFKTVIVENPENP